MKIGPHGEHQGITTAERNVAQLPRQALAIPMHAHHRRIEAGAKLAFFNRVPDHRRARQEHDLGQVGAEQSLIDGKRAQPMKALQNTHLGDIARKNQSVTRLQLLIGCNGGQQTPLAGNFHQKQLPEVAEPVVFHGFANHSRVVSYHHFHQKLVDLCIVPVCRRQHSGHHQHCRQPRKRRRQGDRKKCEEGNTLPGNVLEKTADNQVGRCPDQCQRATQNRGIGDGQQNLARGVVRVLTKRAGEGRNYSSVVHKSGKQHRHTRETQQSPRQRAFHRSAGNRQQPRQALEAHRHHEQK